MLHVQVYGIVGAG